MSTDQATFEQRWLAYARKVLAQDSGCPCDDDEIAWPGYIGKHYATGRVLIVGSIHNAPVLKNSGVYGIVNDVRKWADSSAISDEAYLEIVRDAYEAAIPRWHKYVNANGVLVTGMVWNGILKTIDYLGLRLDDVAFTNLVETAPRI